MLWMETYLFYCSVRLGLIVVAAFAIIQVFIPAILLLSMGMDLLDPVIKLFQNDDQHGENRVVLKILNWVENHAQGFTATAVTFVAVHIIWCILAIFGALKLKKWFLLPFMISEFIRVMQACATHIILMIILKKKLNLGILIALTLLGGFLILYLGYNWATSVALFQIIELVHTARYRKLYGDDPFNPQIPPSYANASLQHAYGTVENVRVLVTPSSGDIDEQKRRQGKALTTAMPVIAVLPANYRNSYGPQVEKKQRNSAQQPQLQPQAYKTYESEQNEYNAEFNNWQWSELMVGRQRKAMMIKPNW
ncbi:uncharacterized protein LOC118736679 [Rhagoletis pomonella]|uniref:uncharacterized protein LOC118736679 n=1 Tax=Rhagoletis pomonella TaxID=28610 RepID=UPI00177E84E6|nr:uncharacterized protein LOC118736679 [Rhagoletis pomonella]